MNVQLLPSPTSTPLDWYMSGSKEGVGSDQESPPFLVPVSKPLLHHNYICMVLHGTAVLGNLARIGHREGGALSGVGGGWT